MSKFPSSGPEPFMPSESKHEYSEIKTSDEEDATFLGALPLPRPRPKSRLRAALSVGFKAVVVALAVYGTVDLGILAAARIRSASIKPCHCGNSVAEAVALGCKYDSLATSWLPDHCRDDEMTRLFEQSGPGPNGEWDYYGSITNRSQTYTLPEVQQLADQSHEYRTVYATTAWHDKHCFFTLLKQVRGKAKLQYTGFVDGVHHAEHCAMQMAERHPQDQVMVVTSPGFGDPEQKEIDELNKIEEIKMKDMEEKKKHKQDH
ncbi:hypothetical protein ESCO_001440 [Escovopsis weberi]|uniref:Uncharacterized protein n=1 Tax=Escovopsis weberi TaxID=150374 RepID=A0A0M9VWH2_ESCWE|nr:hypothetical protein ESCO_001440 [Escovopsis weberi]